MKENTPKDLNNIDLLAIVLGSGRDKAESILQDSNVTYSSLLQNDYEELIKIGLTPSQAKRLQASFELVKRANTEKTRGAQIKSSDTVYAIMHPVMASLPHEEFHVLYTNQNNRIISVEKVSQGGFAGTVVDTRIILRRALVLRAIGLVLCHNHPSGNIQPSENDKKITDKMARAAKMLDMQVLDHVIVTFDGYYSFADNGLLKYY